ncbi:MAG: hypothetical protein WDN72_08570 [Alphaproteobacteria bacterium]
MNEPAILNPLVPKKGRGALKNPDGRFERLNLDYEPDPRPAGAGEDGVLRGQYQGHPLL